MSSSLCVFVLQTCNECDLLPDALFAKAETGFKIDLSQLQSKIKEEENKVAALIAARNPELKLDHKDRFSLLRRILPREKEFTEEDFEAKIILSHIVCAYEIFASVIKYLNELLDRFKLHEKNTKPYYIMYVKIEHVVDAIKSFCSDYDEYEKKLYEILDNKSSPWFIDLPDPDNIRLLVSDALLELRNGELIIPLLRSYFEVNISIILENSVNNKLKEYDLPEYKDKKILFQRGVEFSDLIKIIRRLEVLEEKDIDIILRVHDYTSKSIHIGAFINKLNAWYNLILFERS